MNPSFFSYKSINISWFLAFTIVLVFISSFIVRAMAKRYGKNREKIDDMFFILLISGFIGARIFYVIGNFNLYKDNLFLIFKLSSYNLSLIGGVLAGLIALMIFTKIYKIEFRKLFKIFIIPFYFSMSIGIWLVLFDKLLLPFSISNNPIKILYISMMFLTGMILELILREKTEDKYISFIILAIIIFLYYSL